MFWLMVAGVVICTTLNLPLMYPFPFYILFSPITFNADSSCFRGWPLSPALRCCLGIIGRGWLVHKMIETHKILFPSRRIWARSRGRFSTGLVSTGPRLYTTGSCLIRDHCWNLSNHLNLDLGFACLHSVWIFHDEPSLDVWKGWQQRS